MTLGQRLKQLRKQRGLSQQDISNRLGINRVTYSQYEVDRREPDYNTLMKFADFYNVTIDYLVGYTDNTQESATQEFTKDIIEFLEKTKDLHVGGQKLNESQRQVILDFMRKVVAPRIQNETDNQES